MLLKTSIGRLRLIGIAEGISLLILLAIAMPLKYLAGKPEAVRIVGWIHGVLFIVFMMGVWIVYKEYRWPFTKVIVAFLAAFFPFGTFIFDRQLRKEEAATLKS